MARAKFLRFEGNLILKYDLSNLEHKEDIEKVVNFFSGTVTRMPKNSMLCLLVLTGLSENVVSAIDMSRETEQFSSYFKAAAIIANDPNSDKLAKKVRENLDVYLPIYKDEQEAIEWLLSLPTEINKIENAV